jgi:uncharacterized repeat protein (TIGR02543 family)
MSNFGSGSSSNGQFWYGNTTNFPGFLYKKNLGVGGRRSTKMAPGGNTTCNSATDLYNKYKPGGGGVGASSTANRRAKNRLASVCGSSNKCFPCYNTLGQYSNYTHNPNGFVPCPGTINIISPTPTPTPPSGPYTVTYVGNGSDGGSIPVDGSSPYIAGSTVTVLGNTFTREGYTFAGWSTNSAGTGSDYNGEDLFTINANTTLYAQWIPIISGDYTLTYNGNGGTGSEPALTTEYPSGTPVTILGNSGSLSKPGVGVFAGWNTAADGSGTNYVGGDTFIMPSSNTTLYASYIGGGSRLRYFAGTGGSGTAPSSSGTYYTPFSTANIVGNTGSFSNGSLVFAGWNTAANGSGTSYPVGSNITMPAIGSVSLFAQWIPAGGPFTLTYAAGTGGTGTPPSSSGNSYSAGSPANIDGNTGPFTNGTQVFNGWNTTADGTGKSYSAGSKITMTANTTLFAQWGSPPSLTLTYNANGGTGTIPTQSYPTGAQATILGQSSLTRLGYTFLGWNTAPDGTGTIYQPTNSVTINSNITLYARWVGGIFFQQCVSKGDGDVPGSIPKVYIWGSDRNINLYRDNTNNTITGIIEYLYNRSGTGPYGTGDGPIDNAHTGNIKSSLASVVLKQAGPSTYEINITYTVVYDIPYTTTATLPLTAAYWPTGQTFNTITTSNANMDYTFGTGDTQGSPTSDVTSGCAVDGGTICSSGNCITRNLIISSFYINFSNGTSTRIGLTSTLRWNSAGATMPYTYVYNYTRVELASGPTVTSPTLFVPINTTAINTPNV